MDIYKLCPGCMRERPSRIGPCPCCGFDVQADNRIRPAHILAPYTIIERRYMLGRCIAQAADRLTYTAYDLKTGRTVEVTTNFAGMILHTSRTAPPPRTARRPARTQKKQHTGLIVTLSILVPLLLCVGVFAGMKVRQNLNAVSVNADSPAPLVEYCKYVKRDGSDILVPNLRDVIVMGIQSGGAADADRLKTAVDAVLESGDFPVERIPCARGQENETALEAYKNQLDGLMGEILGEVEIPAAETPWGTIGGIE